MQNCQNCKCVGFPCLNCAEYVYEGRLGPGFASNGIRVIPPNTPNVIRERMQDWIYRPIYGPYRKKEFLY